MKSGQTLKAMVVTRTCSPPVAPMAALGAARVGFHQRLLAVSSRVCFEPVQRPLSRPGARGFTPVSIVSVLVGSRGVSSQFVSMGNQEVLHTEHIALLSLTAAPSESSLQQDPSLEEKKITQTNCFKHGKASFISWRAAGSGRLTDGSSAHCSFQISSKPLHQR